MATTLDEQVKALREATQVAELLGDKQLAQDVQDVTMPLVARPAILAQIRVLETAADVCDELGERDLAQRLRDKAAEIQATISALTP